MLHLRRVAAVLATLTVGSACKDYAYRHEVAGMVVDTKGAPITGVSVQRVDDKNNSYGVDELYKRVTNEKGEFSFVNEGRGPSPMPSAPWRLQVDFGAGNTKVFPLDVRFSEGKDGCTGYCARHLVLTRP